MDKLEYNFSAEPYQYTSDEEMCGWTFVAFPKDLSKEIRENFKHLEEGWGRMKVTAKLGKTEWQTSIWFDTKQDTHLLPLNAKVRKQEKIVLGQEMKISIFI